MNASGSEGTQETAQERPLAGVRVLDMSAVMTGPACTLVLADYGADVIKVEPPEGDVMRHAAPMRNPRMGPMYMHANRNKRSVALDAKHPDGVAAIKLLAASCDVFVHNIRPAVMKRLGLSYEDIRAVRPDVIYLAVVGYGQDGPYGGRPAVDDVIQAATGMADLLARYGGGAPSYVPAVMADRITGISAAHALLAALYQRSRTGRGQAIEVPMYETMVSFLLGDHLGGYSFNPPIGPSGYERLLTPFRKPFQTLDGYLGVAVYTDKQWRSFLNATGRGAMLVDDPRFRDASVRARHYDAAYRLLAEIFQTRTTQAWLTLLEALDIPCSAVNAVEDLLTEPHLQAVGFFEDIEHPEEGSLKTMRVPSRWSGAEMSVRRHAPAVGEHTREVLAEAGLSTTAIDTLLANGAASAHAAKGST